MTYDIQKSHRSHNWKVVLICLVLFSAGIFICMCHVCVNCITQTTWWSSQTSVSDAAGAITWIQTLLEVRLIEHIPSESSSSPITWYNMWYLQILCLWISMMFSVSVSEYKRWIKWKVWICCQRSVHVFAPLLPSGLANSSQVATHSLPGCPSSKTMGVHKRLLEYQISKNVSNILN